MSNVEGLYSINFYQSGYLERTSIIGFVGAASSRDRFNSRLKAAPTGVFFSNLDLPGKHIYKFKRQSAAIPSFEILRFDIRYSAVRFSLVFGSLFPLP